MPIEQPPENQNASPDGSETSDGSEQRSAFITRSARALLETGILTNENGEKNMVSMALHFIDAPTNDIDEIDIHLTNLDDVGSGFLPDNPPEEIQRALVQLYEIKFAHHMNALRHELAKSHPDTRIVQHQKKHATMTANRLNAYGHAEFSQQVGALQQ